MSSQTLKQFLQDDEVLRTRWGGNANENAKEPPKAPNDIQVLHRIPIDVGNPHEMMGDAAIEQALEYENKILRKGLEKLGLSPDQQIQAESLQKFSHNFFASTIEMMHGSLIKCCLQLGHEKEKTHERMSTIQQELGDVNKYPYGTEARAFLLAEESGLAKQLRACGHEIIQSNEIMQRSALLAAMVGNRKPKKKMKKIGWTSANDENQKGQNQAVEV
jgi:hypothetical protein